MSIVLGIANRDFRDSRWVFLGDHTQIGARNAACRWAIHHDLDYVFFIDSDMDFPLGTLPALKAMDCDVACTDMWSRNIPSFRTVMRKGPIDSAGMYPFVPYSGKGVEDIDVCGMACTLIKTSLLKRMEEPWFVSGRHSEDVSFCVVAKQNFAATIRCNFAITAGHWGVARMVGQDWTRDAKNNPGELDMPDMMRRMGAVNVQDRK